MALMHLLGPSHGGQLVEQQQALPMAMKPSSGNLQQQLGHLQPALQA